MEHKEHASFVTLELTLLGLESASTVLWAVSAQAQEQPNACFADAELNPIPMTLIVFFVLLESFQETPDIANHVHQAQCLLHKDNANVTIADQELKQIQHEQDANFV